MCSSGDSTLKDQETQQLDFSKQLSQIFTAQYGDQHELMQFLQGSLKPQIENPQGYAPNALASMKTNAVDTISSQYDKANAALQNSNALLDPSTTSGVKDMQEGSLKAAQASDTAGALNTIDVNDANLKEQNYWNAMNVLSGNVASQFNPLGYAGAETGAANSTTNAGSAYQASKQSQLMGVLGGAVGGAATGLFGKGGKFGCWIAAAVFNEDFTTGVRTGAVREWLYSVWVAHWYAKPVLWLYARCGERLAKSKVAVRVLAPLFRSALRKAQGC